MRFICRVGLALGAGLMTSAAVLSADDPPQAAPGAARNDRETLDPARKWEFTPYLTGSTASVRDKLNGEVERLMMKIHDTQEQVRITNSAMAADEKKAVDKLHKSLDYRTALAEKDKAAADMEAARKGGSSSDRMDASSRFNHARLAIEKMERDAMSSSTALAQDRLHSGELQKDLRRFNEALAKAKKWRDELLDSIRNAFCLRSPLRKGSKGILPRATVVKILGGHEAIFDYDAIELMSRGKDVEGIQSFTVRSHPIRIDVKGIETAGMKEGQPYDVDHVVEVEGAKPGNEMIVYIAHPSPGEADDLFAQLVPIRETVAAAPADKAVRKE